MEILEFNPVECRILNEGKNSKGENILRVLARWQKADTINGNGRLYRKPLLESEIKRLGPMVENGQIFSQAYHPEDGVGNIQSIIGKWEKIWMENDGECLGNLAILPTDAGKNLQVILKAGGKVGMSSRGRGTLTHKKEMFEGTEKEFDEVNSDFQLISPADFVLSPSVDSAGVVKILEQQMNEAEAVEEPVEEREDLKYGRLSEMEMKLSGAKENFGPAKKIKLSLGEERFLSPKLAKILRDEKYKK